MPESNLTTAKYFKPVEESGEATTAVKPPAASPRAAAAGGMERFMSRLSLVLGAALVIGAAIVAVGYLKSAHDRVSARAKQSTAPIDWLLWLGGAKQDQTFAKFVQDAGERNKHEMEKSFQGGPTYNFDPAGPDWSQMQSQMQPAPRLSTPAGS